MDPDFDTVVLSPHLDDAALSCADHLMQWRRAGERIVVVTVFSSFRSERPSPHLSTVLSALGLGSVDEYERLRNTEDAEAMTLLGVDRRLLGFVDAGCRAQRGEPLYPEIADLLSGRPSESDTGLDRKLRASIADLTRRARVIAPLGVGNHVDHVLVRDAARATVAPERLRYYVDFPYARNPLRWSRMTLRMALHGPRSFKAISRHKRKVIATYATQTGFLFRSCPRYPEILIGSRH